MPLNNGDLYLFTDLQVETYKRLPTMLSDALPDDFGKALIDRNMTDPAHGVQFDGIEWQGLGRNRGRKL
jgi:hypothetical protein